jgi:DNA-binding Lrp family transcriptional regulator
MEEAGLITGYRVELASDRVGYPIAAFVRMRARGERGCEILGEFVKEASEAEAREALPEEAGPAGRVPA